MGESEKPQKLGFLGTVATSIDNSSFGFYWGFVGIVIQFIHILFAIAGTFGVFYPGDTAPALVVGEWILALTFAAYFASTLFNFTLKAGIFNKESEVDGRSSDKAKNRRWWKNFKYNTVVVVFAIFDIFVAFYFWVFIVYMEGGGGSDLSGIDTGEIIQAMSGNWFLTAFILAMTLMHPLTLLFYAKEIDLSNWIKKEEK